MYVISALIKRGNSNKHSGETVFKTHGKKMAM